MKEIKNESFFGLFDDDGNLELQNMRFSECSFRHGTFSMTKDLNKISRAKNIEFFDCIEDGIDIGPSILKNVSVHNLQVRDLFILWCPYWQHVTLSGDIGKMKINSWAHFSDQTISTQKPFDAYRKKFYDKVDWALDISKAKFKDFDMTGIPAGLVRRDPETQVVVTRKRALEVATAGWEKAIDPSVKLLPFIINLFLSNEEEDMILVAPMGASKNKRDNFLKGIKEFRRIGLVEPD